MVIGIDSLPKTQGLLVAKNGRAKKQIDSVLSLKGFDIQEMRAEDIPSLVDQEMWTYFGLTTTEYLAEYQLANPQTELSYWEIPWRDGQCLYNQPMICVIGKRNLIKKEISALDSIKVAIERNTRNLSTAVVSEYLKQESITTENITIRQLSGEVEALVMKGDADMCVEIVSSGTTVDNYGLEIYRDVFPIDLVVVANTNYIKQLRERE